MFDVQKWFCTQNVHLFKLRSCILFKIRLAQVNFCQISRNVSIKQYLHNLPWHPKSQKFCFSQPFPVPILPLACLLLCIQLTRIDFQADRGGQAKLLNHKCAEIGEKIGHFWCCSQFKSILATQLILPLKSSSIIILSTNDSSFTL